MIFTVSIGDYEATIDTDTAEQHSLDAIASMLRMVRNEVIAAYEHTIEAPCITDDDE